MALDIHDFKAACVVECFVIVFLVFAIVFVSAKDNKILQETKEDYKSYFFSQKRYYDRNMHIADSVIRQKTDTSLMYFIHEYNETEEWKRIQSFD